jgi:hypothetical protein
VIATPPDAQPAITRPDTRHAANVAPRRLIR